MPRKDQQRLFDQTTHAAGPEMVSPEGVVVRERQCRSLLNRGGIDDYSFNCYTGCGHGCVYCYARFMQRFHPHAEPWGRFVDVKVNAPQVLAGELRRLPPGKVFTCSACDGWQPVERRYRLTRRCCRMLLEAGFALRILTKSELALVDMDVFLGRDVWLGVTIATPSEDQARAWEPCASPVSARVRVLKEAKAAGLETAVMFGPLLPALSDTPQALDELFALAAQTDVDHIWTDALNARPLVWPSVRAFLCRDRPDLIGLYRRVMFDKAYRQRYRAELTDRIRIAAEAAGLAARLA